MYDGKKNLDALLKTYLSEEISPPLELNAALRAEVETTADKSGFSVWWLPACVSVLMTLTLCVLYIYSPLDTGVLTLWCGLSFMKTFCNLALTAICMKKFNLKEGARL